MNQKKSGKLPLSRNAKNKKYRRSVSEPTEKKTAAQSSYIALDSKLGQELLAKNQQQLSVIITVHNEEATIRQTLDIAMLLRPKEIIIIENGSTDQTAAICREYPVRIHSYPFRLGHDIGRSLGAKEATGEVLLFLDGDILLEPSNLLPFAQCCYDGADIALNNLDPLYVNSQGLDYVSMAKHYLNQMMRRGDLGFCSLTAIPHAITRAAAQAIGIENLAVPPKAHAIALYNNLVVVKSAVVNVIKTNKIRTYHKEVGKLILGDHIEAIHWLQEHTSARISFQEDNRMCHPI